ncbi:MAG: hypothetical protein JSU63_16125 [Phycisphaerales bacterium]|nr:MAG: hypothetical protein JSU63_16125 [Phycisphaerales bacterium]
MRKKLTIAGVGTLVLGAGSYFALSNSPKPERVQPPVAVVKDQRPKPTAVEKGRRERAKSRKKNVVETNKRRPVRGERERPKGRRRTGSGKRTPKKKTYDRGV